jgi:hypothetical protein
MMEKFKKISPSANFFFFGQTWANIAHDRRGGRWTSPVVGLGGGGTEVLIPAAFSFRATPVTDRLSFLDTPLLRKGGPRAAPPQE